MRIERFMSQAFTRREQISFFKRLLILLSGGIPLGTALCIVKNQASTSQNADTYEKLHASILQGQTFSLALQTCGFTSDPLTLCMLRVGETHGILEKNISHIIQELTKREALKKKIVSLCIYPLLIILTAFATTFFIIAYLFPKVLPVIESLNTPLPVITQALLFVFHYGWTILLALVALCIGAFACYKISLFRRSIHAGILRLPLFGSLVREYHVCHFARSMGLLLSVGTPLVTSIRESADVMRHPHYRSMVNGMEQSIIEGKRVSQHLALFPHLVSHSMVNVIASGEKTGELPSSLLYVASLSEESLNDSAHILSTMIEPILMIVVGGIVGSVALAIISPIYGITQSLYLR